ncbi:MAG: PEP-CTERM sorting domain-containing protein [Phycisphaerales bacterium]|nr:MAG: PEP-CTERM sorting domain-containing protein [Phycisphaerales bacterium]
MMTRTSAYLLLILLFAPLSADATLTTISEDTTTPQETDLASQAPEDLEAVWSYGGILGSDFAAVMITAGCDILTGGPSLHGDALAGASDVVGPDLEQIIAFLESDEYFSVMSKTFPRFASASAPRGLGGAVGANMKPGLDDLWPQVMWLLGARTFEVYDQSLVNQISVPEPASAILLSLAGLILRYRRQSRR